MEARRQVKAAGRLHDEDAMRATRGAVDAAKIALGERGPVWWSDGAKDFNRYLIKNTPYAEWYSRVDIE